MNYKCQVNFSSSDHPWLAEIPVAIGVPGRDVIDEGLKLETIAGCRMVPKVGSRMGAYNMFTKNYSVFKQTQWI